LEFAKGQPAKALELLTRLLASQPDLPEALLERARCEVALGKNPAALAD
jgi:Tfp pilus assembly protein PilF